MPEDSLPLAEPLAEAGDGDLLRTVTDPNLKPRAFQEAGSSTLLVARDFSSGVAGDG